MLVLDAEPAARAQIRAVDVEVRSGKGAPESWQRVEHAELAPKDADDWPLELAIVPLNDDSERGFAVSATARDASGRAMLRLRAISGFVRGQTRNLLLYFDAACLRDRPECGSDQSCAAGVCSDAHRSAEQLPPYARGEDGRPVTMRPPAPDAGMPDAGLPAAGAGGAPPLAEDCVDKQPGEQFCTGKTRYACSADRLSTIELAVCKPSQRCSASNGRSTCADRDECAEDRDGCDSDPDACVNAPGGFSCACPAGFAGDGVGEDGCKPSGCGPQVGCDDAPDACVETRSGPTCTCPDTHVGDGRGPNGCRWKVVGVATGDLHTCAQLANGAVKCWGRNVEGQLGQGHTAPLGATTAELGDALPALDFGRGRKVVELIAGGLHSCVRFEDGKVKCWGENALGALGLGDTEHRGDGPDEMGDELPELDLGTDYRALQLAASWNHSCARLATGGVKCWGSNEGGMLGIGESVNHGDMPDTMGDHLPEVMLGASGPVKQVVVGDFHSCAVLDDDRVKCWGLNMFSGDSSEARGDTPEELGQALAFVSLGEGLTVRELATGGYHLCARLSDGTVKCWGANADGNLGRGDTWFRGAQASDMGDALGTVDLGSGLTVVQLAGGQSHTCARFDDGRVKCWGKNDHGQLGLGDRENRGDQPGEMGDALPFVDLGEGAVATQLVSLENHTCALLQDGRLKCWGANGDGQLGLGLDAGDRGDEPGEMGDQLPAVDLGGR
jgi:alpha-tubulin suppressor-like RCC1 family protein